MSNIKMGKNIIDNLTTGMYEDSKIIYREYIQNSTDAIDKAIKLGIYNHGEEPSIYIQIDEDGRRIIIKDNATGISRLEVHKKLANIADSDKEKGVDKGFRGIGRLGGLAYCDELRFITSCKGESVKTIMIWNAKECRRCVENKDNNESAEEIISKIIKYKEEACDIEEHFFTVELCNISKDNNDLLNEDEVKEYIQWNAPVANKKFIYKNKILEYAKKIGSSICEYNISFEGDDIYKNYGTILYEKANQSKTKTRYDEIYDLEFKELKNEKGELLAWMWYGISAFDRQIPVVNKMRGIRLRKDNIQIGSSETLVNFFRENRGNYYFIGEVHAIHKDLIPNARRDYFNENNTRNEFEAQLRYYLRDELHKLYNEGNKTKNAFKREFQFNQEKIKFEQMSQIGFVNEKEQQKMEENLLHAKKEYEKGKKELENIKGKSEGNKALKKVISVIEENHKNNMKKLNEEKEDKKQKKHEKKQIDLGNIKKEKKLFVSGLDKLNNQQRKLVSKIYGIINDVLPNDLSRSLIEKIQEELKK